MAISRVEALHELIQIGPCEALLLRGEAHVGADVVEPDCLRPGGLAGGFAVEEEHVRLVSFCGAETVLADDQVTVEPILGPPQMGPPQSAPQTIVIDRGSALVAKPDPARN